MIPYGHQSIDESDIEEVVKVLRSGWITQGPSVLAFEEALAKYCGAKYAVVVSNGTAALHAAFMVAGLKQGDEFITSPVTFVATANAGLWQGATPIFVDIDSKTGNIDVEKIEERITEKTKALVPIDYTGRPADLNKIKELAQAHNLVIIEDACQALGASYQGKKIGSISDLTTFSFHPVKSITTGEGGAILTDNEDYYNKMKRFVTHGVTKTGLEKASPGDWYFEMQDLGLNYRLTDFQSALGISQLKKLDSFISKRRELANRYDRAFCDFEKIILPESDNEENKSAWHLYTIRLKGENVSRKAEIFKQLRENGIGVQVHHIPVHLMPYYEKRFGLGRGDYPVTEQFYDSVISLPLFPDLSFKDQDIVINVLKDILL